VSAPDPSKRLSLRGLRRRLWLIPLAVAAVVAVAFGVSAVRGDSTTAQSVVVVTSHPGPKGPGYASEAAKLALTYAGVLEQDPVVLDRIGTAVGRSRDDVRDRFSVVNDTDTAVLRLRFRDDDRGRAALGATTAAQAIAGSRPASPRVGPDSVELVKPAGLPAKATTGLSTAALVAAGLLGLLLGAILLVAWERADPRVDDVADAGATGLATSLLDTMSPATAAALVERWGVMTDGRPARVAVIPATKRLAALAPEVSAWLARAASEVQRARRLEIVVGGLPGSGTADEVEALRSEVNVVLAPLGIRERDLERALGALEQFDVPAQWLLLTGSPRRLRGRLQRDRPAGGGGGADGSGPRSSDEPAAQTVTR
jgi:hypothetical protein